MRLISEDEINTILDEFIDKYIGAMTPFAEKARKLALEELRAFLQAAQSSDFVDAEDFAEQVFTKIEESYGVVFDSVKAQQAIKTTTKAIYTFYRLKDETPFGKGGSPIGLKFGAPDTRAIRFFGDVDHFYFSKFVRNDEPSLKKFFQAEYLEKGAALFGRETPESLDDFRKAAGGKLANMNDRAVKLVVQNGVQRVRNYAHIHSLRQAEIETATYVAVLDRRTTHICRTLDGKKIRIGVAASTVDELTSLEPGDFALRMFQSPDAKEMQVANTDPEATEKYFKKKVDANGYVKDDFVSSGLALPPLHANCRTRLAGDVPGVSG